MDDLINYAGNVNSQYGEDCIIQEIMKRLDIRNGFFVEFGAWDGRYMSNTYWLVSKDHWKGIYIESDPQKYEALLKTKEMHPGQIETICALVESIGANTLDNLLSKTDTPNDFDLLSIDIDSYDWQIWQSFKYYRPKIVVIECNSLILPGVWQVHTPGVCESSSFTALVELGKEKGYHPICHTGNLFFAALELLDRIGLDPKYIANPNLLYNYAMHQQECLSAGKNPYL